MIAFNQQERAQIQQALKREARKCAIALGMRRTTVSQLAQAADISTGAFYSFYPTKELLFFELLEDLHAEIYQASLDELTANAALPPAERAASAVLAACRTMETSGMMDFMERDVQLILRKIPKDVQETHYHSDEAHIRELLQTANLRPTGGIALAAATVRGLFLTISHREDIGEMYTQVLETLVHGACDVLFSA